MDKRQIVTIDIVFNEDKKIFEILLTTYDNVNMTTEKETINVNYSMVMKLLKVLEGMKL